MAHLNAFLECYNSYSSANCNESISLFGLIILHSSNRIATETPVTKISLF